MKRLFAIIAVVIAIAGSSSLRAQSWSLTGNALSSGTEYVGSSNGYPLLFKTNNVERARILSGGNFGIGTTSPAGFFSIGATSQFQINSSGVITSAVGITSSGNITFSGLNANQVVQTNGSKQLVSALVSLGTQVTGTLDVDKGGTGAPTLTGILQGNGTTPISAITGISNYLSKWSSTTPYLKRSIIYDNGTQVGVGTYNPIAFFQVSEDNTAGWLARFEKNKTVVSMAHHDGYGLDVIVSTEPTANTYAFDVKNSDYLHIPLFTVRNDGNVGIGTSDSPDEMNLYGPSQKLTINHDDSTGGILLNRVSKAQTSKSEIKFDKNGQELYAIGNDFEGDGRQSFFIWDHPANSCRFLIDSNGRVGIGMIPPTDGRYRLYVPGGIAAREVLVTAGTFPDYVFDDDYKILSLNELDKYIGANRHLPDLPSAAEIEKNEGFEIGDMQIRLVKKVEEQTLYILALQKQLDELKAQVNGLKGK